MSRRIPRWGGGYYDPDDLPSAAELAEDSQPTGGPMSTSEEYSDIDGGMVPVASVDAGDLVPGDEFPAHDGQRHIVMTVWTDEGMVKATVERSDGTSYIASWGPDHVVKVVR